MTTGGSHGGLPIIERLHALTPGTLDALLDDSERLGSRIVRRLVDEWSSGVNRFDRSGEALFGGRVDGQLVGICGLNVDPYAADDGIGRVRHLYVWSIHRRLGVGRALVTHVIQAAHGRFRDLRLRTNNPAAAHLYQTLGFRSCTEGADWTHALALGPRP